MPTPSIEIKKQWRKERKGLLAGGTDTYVIFKRGKTGYKYHHFERIRNDSMLAYAEISVCERAEKMESLPNKNLMIKKKYLHDAVLRHNKKKNALVNKTDTVGVYFCMI